MKNTIELMFADILKASKTENSHHNILKVIYQYQPELYRKVANKIFDDLNQQVIQLFLSSASNNDKMMEMEKLNKQLDLIPGKNEVVNLPIKQLEIGSDTVFECDYESIFKNEYMMREFVESIAVIQKNGKAF